MKPREIVVISGKGGTGKTTLTASLAATSPRLAVFCDADVDAPDLEILLRPESTGTYTFWGMQTAKIHESCCIGCGACVEACRFRAIDMEQGKAHVETTFCEGCAACKLVCPNDCVEMVDTKQGKWFTGETAWGPLFHARLNPGGENSGKLITILREETRKAAESLGRDLILVDGPPGIACPAISALSGADMALVVTEPTLSGQHDLKRIAGICDKFEVPVVVALNKTDLSTSGAEKIRETCRDNGWRLAAEIPFMRPVVDRIAAAEIPTREMDEAVQSLWEVLAPSGAEN